MSQQDTGSHAAGEDRGRRLLWLWLLLGALALALAIWAIVELFDDDVDEVEALPVTTGEPSVEPSVQEPSLQEPSAEPTVPVDDVTEAEPTETVEATDAATATATATDTAAAPAPAPGPVLVGDVDVLAATPEQLSGLVGQPVTAESVQVVELVADEAFLVGPEAGRTILVRLGDFAGEDAPESPFQVEEGGEVSITGTLQQVDEEFLSSVQLDPAEELAAGDYYIQAEEITGVR